jgi:hypothetical protein
MPKSSLFIWKRFTEKCGATGAHEWIEIKELRIS